MAGNHNSGRKPKYVTIEVFNKFLTNDFTHLRRLVWGILFAVILVPTAFFICIVQILGN